MQRHARAAALCNRIDVIYVVKATDRSKAVDVRSTFNEIEGVREWHYYYHSSNIGGKIASFYKWKRIYKTAVRKYIEEYGLPDLVHVHVPWKAGLVALWVKRQYGLPFVVTEHWGIYNNSVHDRFSRQPFYVRKVIRNVLGASSGLHSVSEFLARGISETVCRKPVRVIPNAVDTRNFNYSASISKPAFRFLHVSNMVPLKNVRGILEAAVMLHRKGRQFELVIIGGSRHLAGSPELVEELGEKLSFSGEIAYTAVAAEMKNANILILFSNMENSPCVIGEALCCGLPVIATRVGGIPEITNQTNSILVEPGDIAGLASKMEQALDRDSFNRKEISTAATEKFSYEKIGVAFNNWYRDQLNNR